MLDGTVFTCVKKVNRDMLNENPNLFGDGSVNVHIVLCI